MHYKRIVIKVGTNLVNNNDNSLNTVFLKGIAEQISTLHKKGHEIILVTSGAVASGRGEVTLKKESKNIPYRQALAAVGQGILINIYHELFHEKGVKIAQALLTNHDFTNRKSYITTRNTLNLLLELGVVPIINENDVTTYAELKFGDNDMLSAKTAVMVSSDLLLILTDVTCVYDKDPKKHPEAQCILRIEKIDDKVRKLAEKSSSKKSIGGMESKIMSAEYVIKSGIPAIIVGGNIENVLTRIVEKNEQIGTFVVPVAAKNESRKAWIKSDMKKNTKIVVDDGARKALIEKKTSLLPIGIKEVIGEFKRGDVIGIYDLSGSLIGAGQTNYKSDSLQKIKGHRSEEIADILGNVMEMEVIHRDNMVVFQ